MLPDIFIYDELKRRRDSLDEQRDNRPQLEVPRYVPYWPESEFDSPAQQGGAEDAGRDRGVTIIQI